MNSIFDKIRDIKNSGTTYNFGILQNKVYKILKSSTDDLLKPHGITTVDWAMLGLLYDHKGGIRLIEIAELLAVEAPFVTALADDLEKKGLVFRTTSQKDKRSKYLQLSDKGRKMVKDLESHLQKETKSLIRGISFRDLLAYRRVLNKIVENQLNQDKN